MLIKRNSRCSGIEGGHYTLWILYVSIFNCFLMLIRCLPFQHVFTVPRCNPTVVLVHLHISHTACGMLCFVEDVQFAGSLSECKIKLFVRSFSFLALTVSVWHACTQPPPCKTRITPCLFRCIRDTVGN